MKKLSQISVTIIVKNPNLENIARGLGNLIEIVCR